MQSFIRTLTVVLLLFGSTPSLLCAEVDSVIVRDVFPFSLLVPRLPASFDNQKEAVSVTLESSWSNTINQKGSSFVIDLETRVLEPIISFKFTETSYFRLNIPWIWKGGGVLDTPIYEWHDFFGLSQGPRNSDRGKSDDFLIKAKTEENRIVRFSRRGYGFGNVNLSYLFDYSEYYEELKGKLHIGLELPTGRSEYGLTGVSPFIGGSISYFLSEFTFFAIGQYSYLSDPEVSGFVLKRHQASAYLGFKYPFKFFTTQVGMQYNSDLLENVPRFPSYQWYLDLATIFAVSDSSNLSFVLRENPAPDTGSTDVGFYLVFNYHK